VYENYLKQKQIEWKETAKDKKKKIKQKRGYLVLVCNINWDWRWSPVGLAWPSLVPVGIRSCD
jgi:hypothetical protein